MLKDTGSVKFMPRTTAVQHGFSQALLAEVVVIQTIAKTKEAIYGRIPLDENAGVFLRPSRDLATVTRRIAA